MPFLYIHVSGGSSEPVKQPKLIRRQAFKFHPGLEPKMPIAYPSWASTREYRAGWCQRERGESFYARHRTAITNMLSQVCITGRSCKSLRSKFCCLATTCSVTRFKYNILLSGTWFLFAEPIAPPASQHTDWGACWRYPLSIQFDEPPKLKLDERYGQWWYRLCHWPCNM